MDLKQLVDLTPEQQELLALWLAQQNDESPVSRIHPVPRDGALPLSFAQQRLWFLHQLLPESALYNIPAAIRLFGVLEVAAMEQSLQAVVHRHEVLRTSFPTVAGQPLQVIAKSLDLPLPVTDLQALPPQEREAQARRLLNQEAEMPFDLAQGPLLRVKLLRLGVTDHILLVTVHHIVSDHWSSGVLIHEVATLYRAFSQGRPSPLPELTLQYADFAHWQQHWLTGEVLAEQVGYWQKQLAGAPALLALPTDYPRPPVQRYRGAVYSFTLPAPLVTQLKTLSQREGVTLFMTLLAVFKVLLYRYTSQEDILVGTPIANRNRAEIEPLIGFFVNTLVLRTDLSGEPTFREMLQRVRGVTLDAYDHQDLPFEKLVEHLQPERAMSYAPLFQVLFVLQNTPMPAEALPGLTFSPVLPEQNSAKFDLTLTLLETAQGLTGAFEYNTDLLVRETVMRMAEHFITLAQDAVDRPTQSITRLHLLTPTERDRLLRNGRGMSMEFPDQCCIHQLFEAQVERTPDAVALVFAGKSLRYRELNQRANQVAHALQSRGVGPEVLVGLCLERSAALVVGLLAILKAGGAYVPLDPNYPTQRLSLMLEDIALLLTEQSLLERLPQTPAPVFFLDQAAIALLPTNNPTSPVTAEHLAYVIYTSGSTGRPKGVQIQHRSVVHFLTVVGIEPGLTPEDVLLAVTSLSFDIAALELLLPLTTGAQVVLAPAAADPVWLQQAMHDVTVMQATPATWRMLVQAGWMGHPRLKILCGGEALTADLAEQLLARGSALWNLYGPTETTIWSSIQRVTPGTVTLGHPLPNTQVYVLDPQLQPVPVGIAGEVYIGGFGLARGYLKRPDLTAERFIPDPFTPKARLYKTGDRARYRADSSLEYLGRLDFQVKIRGFRIELGEVEAVLAQHPHLTASVVVATEDHLVAYFVATVALPASELRTFLKTQLPDYMIPSIFVPLEALPLTPNGKVDRKALPAPELGRIDASFVAPQTPVEQILAEIWAEILKRPEVGLQDDFFALGGHSLLATQVVSRVREVLGVTLLLHQFFEAPTLAQLSTLLLQLPQRKRIEKRAQLLIALADLPETQVTSLLQRNRSEESKPQ
ncbi:non-ribosomal peptide synthetase [Anthocerotibacter panamensis]|uniref:non-ribosomal peptide synthetase n=1 Tax=Anthocerotibacter panamensis TaxID=2857077 RepID=UPI001C404D05|nr:non-ribosomal peptide synthetase [Anthocerotibacter panamensis]